jgi:hypothetical protein
MRQVIHGVTRQRSRRAGASRTDRAVRGEPRTGGSGIPRRDAWLVGGLCLVAAARVLVFSAAFPLFGNIDEQAHVDLVHKYARGFRPGPALAPFDPETVRLFVRYGSLEFAHPPERFPGGRHPPPLWVYPADVAERAVEAAAPRWDDLVNHESHAPPLYHWMAAGWYRLLGWLGMGEARPWYLVRMLNAPLIALLVGLAHRCCARLFPGRTDIALGVPLLLAFLPLDVYYCVHPDVLLPPLFAAGLLWQLHWFRDRASRPWSGTAAGFAAGLGLALKPTNVALLAVLLGLAAVRLRRLRARRGLAAALRDVAIPIVAAILPIALLLGWNVALVGDATATRAKVEYLGWDASTPAAALEHPLLTPRGLWTFWSELMHKLWRGELRWHVAPLASAVADAFYAVSSLVLLLVAATCAIASRTSRGPSVTPEDRVPRRCASGAMWAAFLSSVLVLAGLSMAIDFGDSFYPSRDRPYLTSARLISGALVPFLVLYVEGVACATRRWSRVAGPLVLLAVIAAAMTLSELLLSRHVFANPYNWFHLP